MQPEPTGTLAPVQWNEQLVFEALRTHFVEGAVVLLPQVASETGSAPRRTADAIAMQLWPSRGLTIEGVEIKVSRSDLLREYAQPEKSDIIAQFCDKWWIAAPAGVVKKSDFEDGTFPKTWGCIEVNVQEPGLVAIADGVTSWLRPHVFKAKVIKKAEENPEAKEPTRRFLAAILRSLQAHESPESQVERKLKDIQRRASKEAWDFANKHAEKSSNTLLEYQRHVSDFERVTGLSVGVQKGYWREDDRQKSYEDQRRRLQIANSLDSYFEKATALASSLRNLSAEATRIADALTSLNEQPKEQK